MIVGESIVNGDSARLWVKDDEAGRGQINLVIFTIDATRRASYIVRKELSNFSPA